MSQPGPAVAGISTLRDVARRLPGRILGIDAGGSGTRVALLENGTVTVRCAAMYRPYENAPPATSSHRDRSM